MHNNFRQSNAITRTLLINAKQFKISKDKYMNIVAEVISDRDDVNILVFFFFIVWFA